MYDERDDEILSSGNSKFERSLYAILSKIPGNQPKNSLEQIKPQMTLYTYSQENNSHSSLFFASKDELTQYLNHQQIINYTVIIVEYLGEGAERSDVIKLTENGKNDFYCQVGTSSYQKYNVLESGFEEQCIWDHCDRELSTVYAAFRDRGIELSNDVKNKTLIKQRHSMVSTS